MIEEEEWRNQRRGRFGTKGKRGLVAEESVVLEAKNGGRRKEIKTHDASTIHSATFKRTKQEERRTKGNIELEGSGCNHMISCHMIMCTDLFMKEERKMSNATNQPNRPP